MNAAQAAMIADPDVITAAIQGLAWVAAIIAGVISILGSTLIGTFLYIWHQAKIKVDSIDEKVDRIATGLEHLTLDTKIQIAEIKTRCEEKHTQRRSSDIID